MGVARHVCAWRTQSLILLCSVIQQLLEYLAAWANCAELGKYTEIFADNKRESICFAYDYIRSEVHVYSISDAVYVIYDIRMPNKNCKYLIICIMGSKENNKNNNEHLNNEKYRLI